MFCVTGCSQTTEAGSSTSEEHSAVSTETTPTAASEEVSHLPVGPGTGAGAHFCGEEISGSAHTSCPFAREVVSAFLARYGVLKVPPSEVTAASPTTHKTYNLRCAVLQNEIVECSVGDADVLFPLSKAEGSSSGGSGSQGGGESEGESDSVGSSSHAGDAKFCEEHQCIGNFTTEEGTVVECSDGTFSHAGGISGACSDHGGESSSDSGEAEGQGNEPE